MIVLGPKITLAHKTCDLWPGQDLDEYCHSDTPRIPGTEVQAVAGALQSRGAGPEPHCHLGGTRHRRWCGPPPSRRGPAVLNAPAPSPYCGKSCCIHHCQAPSLNKFECTEPWAAVSIISLSSLNISLTFFFFQISFYPTVSPPFHLPPLQPSSDVEDSASRA